MKKSCKYCGRIHDISYICPKRPKKIWRGNKQTKEKFRNTAAWQSMRDSIKFRDMNFCQICLKEGKYISQGLEVHHITPLCADYDMRLCRTNLITLCSVHHKQADAGEISADELRAIAMQREDEVMTYTG